MRHMTRVGRSGARWLWLVGMVLAVGAIVVSFLPWGDESSPGDSSAGETTGEPSGTVTVLAAASLTEPFEELADELHETYPELETVLSFGPSSGLAEQVRSGAPADILATASTTTMEPVVDAGDVAGAPRIFARNSLVLVVPSGNPAGVTSLDDLARAEPRIALCEPQVPCGAAAQDVLEAAEIVAAPDTLATDVKEALALVTLGEVDAALVYGSDAVSAGDAIEVVDDPRTEAAMNDYPVAVLSDAPNPGAARAVADAIAGEPGRSILARAGFLAP